MWVAREKRAESDKGPCKVGENTYKLGVLVGATSDGWAMNYGKSSVLSVDARCVLDDSLASQVTWARACWRLVGGSCGSVDSKWGAGALIFSRFLKDHGKM